MQNYSSQQDFKLLMIFIVFSACRFSFSVFDWAHATTYFETAVHTQLKIALSMQVKNKWLNNFNCIGFSLHSPYFDTLDWALWIMYSLQKDLHIKIHIPVQLAEIYHQLAFLLLTKNTYWLSAQHSASCILLTIAQSFHLNRKRTQKKQTYPS